jgi:hypothetical protein
VDKEHAASMDIDICFVMDCTGSMGSWIAAGKQQIIEIAKSIQKQVDESHGHAVNLRAAFVAYRDHCDGHLRIQETPFTPDISRICTFCGSMSATGGGDGPEDVAGAMCAVLRLDWKAKAKFIVWVADAPAHGTSVRSARPGVALRVVPSLRVSAHIIVILNLKSAVQWGASRRPSFRLSMRRPWQYDGAVCTAGN